MNAPLSVDDQQLKAATKALVKVAGGQVYCEEAFGLAQAQWSNYGNPTQPAYFIPANRIAQLEAITHRTHGHPLVTRELCRLAGGIFVPLPHFEGGHDTIPAQMMVIAKELGEVSASISDGLADDNRLDAEETERVLRELDDLDRASAQLRIMLKRGLPAEQ